MVYVLDVLENFVPRHEGRANGQITDMGREFLHHLAQWCLIWLLAPHPECERSIRL